MDCTVRFWNNETGVVCSRYFDSKFLLGSNSKNLFEKLLESTKSLDFSKLLQLSMDGPNVNWNVLKLMSTNQGEKELPNISIGSCSSILFMGHFKVVLTRRITSLQRYFVQCTIFLRVTCSD